MQQVDLKLAINYIPACACLIKTTAILMIIGIIHPGHEIGGYTILCSVLYLDRLFTYNYIFDGNSILLAVFFSNVVNTVKTTNSQDAMPFALFLVNMAWISCCIYMIIEPPHLKRIFERKHRMYHAMPAILMVSMITSMLMFHMDAESAGMKIARGVSFAILSLAWIYIVGIHQSHGIDHLKETSAHFISKFAPLLYSPHWIALVFGLVALGALVYQLLHIGQDSLLASQNNRGDVEAPHPPQREDSSNQHIRDPREPTVEELYLLAKQKLTKERLPVVME